MAGSSISEAEWQVMEAIWDHSPVTANDVVTALERRADWHPRTIKTMLNRLVRKGVLTFETDGKRYLYSPRLSKDECVREASRSFVRRVFGGSITPALVHMVQNATLSPAEIEELKAILEQKGKPRRKLR